jgi:hypothetical protein
MAEATSVPTFLITYSNIWYLQCYKNNNPMIERKRLKNLDTRGRVCDVDNSCLMVMSITEHTLALSM